jgi:hypothetical protein
MVVFCVRTLARVVEARPQTHAHRRLEASMLSIHADPVSAVPLMVLLLLLLLLLLPLTGVVARLGPAAVCQGPPVEACGEPTAQQVPHSVLWGLSACAE